MGAVRRIAVIGLVAAVAALGIVAFVQSSDPIEVDASDNDGMARKCRDNPQPAIDLPDEVGDLVAAMSLDEKIRQLFIAGFHGTSLSGVTDIEATFNSEVLAARSLGESMENGALGGVILFGRNVEDADQMAALAREIQAAAANRSAPGLLIAVDHEGGQVTRLKTDITNYPSAPILGAIGDADLVERSAAATARQLRSLGVTLVLSPVADVGQESGSGPLDSRTFGSDASVVAEAVHATMRGYMAAGIAGAAKHFPGLGSAATDSHVAMPRVTLSVAEWEENDRIPFEAGIDAGAPVVLIGHTRFASLDATGTATSVSSDVIDGELRNCLGFAGVVMTDALDMGAVASIGSQEDAAVAALAAGADLILLPRDLESVVAAVRDSVEGGELTLDRIDSALGRILLLKLNLGILDAAAVNITGGRDTVGTSEHQALLEEIVTACMEAGLDGC